MRKQFVTTASELALADDKVVIVLGDISHFQFMGLQGKIPARVHNMGICENTILSVGAGLGAQGFFPFLHTINPFLTERCLEQIKLDLCYNQFGANIVTTGASFDYALDGATHHCYTELAILRLLPGMEVTSRAIPRNSTRLSAASIATASRRISGSPTTATSLNFRSSSARRTFSRKPPARNSR